MKGLLYRYKYMYCIGMYVWRHIGVGPSENSHHHQKVLFTASHWPRAPPPLLLFSDFHFYYPVPLTPFPPSQPPSMHLFFRILKRVSAPISVFISISQLVGINFLAPTQADGLDCLLLVWPGCPCLNSLKGLAHDVP